MLEIDLEKKAKAMLKEEYREKGYNLSEQMLESIIDHCIFDLTEQVKNTIEEFTAGYIFKNVENALTIREHLEEIEQFNMELLVGEEA